MLQQTVSKRKWKGRKGYLIVNGKSQKGGRRKETKRQAILEKIGRKYRMVEERQRRR